MLLLCGVLIHRRGGVGHFDGTDRVFWSGYEIVDQSMGQLDFSESEWGGVRVASATVPADYADEDIPGLIWGLAQGNHPLALCAIRLDRLPRGADRGTIVEWDFAFTDSGPSGFVPARRSLSVKQLGRVWVGPEQARTLLVPLEAVDDLAMLHRDQYECGVRQYSVFGLEANRSSELTRELARPAPRHRRRFRLWKAIAPSLNDVLRGNDRFVSFYHADPGDSWGFLHRFVMVATRLSP